MSNVNPLNHAHLEQIRAGIRAADQAIMQAEMAMQAGLPATAQLEAAKKYKEQLLKFKQVYFPGQ